MSTTTPSATPTFEELVELRRECVSQALDQVLPSAKAPPDRLHKAMRHSVQAGGKRLRPILVLAAHELFPSSHDPLPAALAVECLHTYSLVHDDLPAMDDSDLRRGRPTCHLAFDEATAILVGDALLTLAFQILADSYAPEPAISVALIRALSAAAGSSKLIGGQMDDLLAEDNSEPSAELISSIHARKTAALIAASLEMGAILGDRGEDLSFISQARRMGIYLGYAFQAIDDILDATAMTTDLGKSTEQDAAHAKSTLVSFFGIDKTRHIAARRTQQALDSCRELGGNNEFLLQLIEWLGSRGH
ncbi:MAG: farnesyl diphosphate synthase [Opitutales bacterium]